MLTEHEPSDAETENPTAHCINDSNSSTLVISDSYGDGMAGENAISGAFTVYYNDSIIAVSPENGNFGSQFSVYGIGNGCNTHDIALTKITIPTIESPQSIAIRGTIYNNGTDTLHSVDVEYKIDEFISTVYTQSGISIPIGSSFEFVHSEPYNFESDKLYLINVSISNPNGIEDQHPSDNSKLHKLIINEHAMPKRQLIEHFTSSTNDECFTFTPELDFMLSDNFDAYSLIRYQLNTPEPGDPYYIDQTGARAEYYQVTSIPSLHRNGSYNMDISLVAFNEYVEQKTILNIESTAF
jgi:hypothetical protein